MGDGEELPEGWCESVQRMAQHCANTYRGDHALSYADRREAAMDGIVAEVVGGGWPEPGEKFTRLFNAGKLNIDHVTRESRKHLHHWSYWYEPPGAHDAQAEAITDRLGINQLTHALTEREWSAVWAYAEVMGRDGKPVDAAALLGVTEAQFWHWLEEARQRARLLWCAPGESLPGKQYRRGTAQRRDKQAARRDYQARVQANRERRDAEPPYDPPSGDRLLTSRELEALSGIPKVTIKNWSWCGYLPARGKRGQANLYSLHEFTQRIASVGRDTADEAAALQIGEHHGIHARHHRADYRRTGHQHELPAQMLPVHRQRHHRRHADGGRPRRRDPRPVHPDIHHQRRTRPGTLHHPHLPRLPPQAARHHIQDRAHRRMTDDVDVRSSGSRKLTPFDRRKLQRALAEGTVKKAQLARDFGVSTSYVSAFAKQYAREIDDIKRALNDQFAGLWIADKESRIVAYQTEYAMALGNDKASHHEWVKARTAILHTVAEELGQLPPRAAVVVQPVEHIIIGVDMDALR